MALCCYEGSAPDEGPSAEANAILVTAGHSAKGRFIVKALFEAKKGFQVKALVDDPFSEQSQVIADMGAMVVKGSISTLERIWLATKGCGTAICCLDPMDIVTDDAKATHERVLNFAEHCHEKKIRNFVLCGDYAELQKLDVDPAAELLKLGFKSVHVVAQPLFCFEDFTERLGGMFVGLSKNSCRMELDVDPKSELPMACAEDAGKIVANCALNPSRLTENPIRVNATARTLEGYAKDLSEATGIQVSYARSASTGRISAKEALQYKQIISAYGTHGQKRMEGIKSKDFQLWAEDVKFSFKEFLKNIRRSNSKPTGNSESLMAMEEMNLLNQLKKVNKDASHVSLSGAAKSIHTMRLSKMQGGSRSCFTQMGRSATLQKGCFDSKTQVDESRSSISMAVDKRMVTHPEINRTPELPIKYTESPRTQKIASSLRFTGSPTRRCGRLSPAAEHGQY